MGISKFEKVGIAKLIRTKIKLLLPCGDLILCLIRTIDVRETICPHVLLVHVHAKYHSSPEILIFDIGGCVQVHESRKTCGHLDLHFFDHSLIRADEWDDGCDERVLSGNMKISFFFSSGLSPKKISLRCTHAAQREGKKEIFSICVRNSLSKDSTDYL